jgi:hypothetical protein
LCCEINRLCYPKAALFALCVAVAAYNVQSAIKGVLRAVHGQKKIDEACSRYFMAGERARLHEGMRIALPAQEWENCRGMPLEELAGLLRKVAQQVQLHRYPKSHRGPKKPKPKRRYSRKHPHVSTAGLLDERKARKQRAKK